MKRAYALLFVFLLFLTACGPDPVEEQQAYDEIQDELGTEDPTDETEETSDETEALEEVVPIEELSEDSEEEIIDSLEESLDLDEETFDDEDDEDWGDII
jgi:hypothetical protein